MHAAAPLRQCIRCVLDTGDKAEIDFDSSGLCNHCRSFDEQIAALPSPGAERERAFRETIARVKDAGRGRRYDCVIGLSGGVDSSYLAYLASREGLKPLVIHLDNGWNSELAVSNIERIVDRFGYDLRTYVLDWIEFRELQLAYLRASVVDVEVLTDHAIYTILMRAALENRIQFVLSGNNVATEGVLPYSWTFRKSDHVNIQDIHRRFGRGTIRTYPLAHSILKRHVRAAGIETVNLLDYVSYQVTEVKRVLEAEIGWRDYGGKHFESVFTRFYQTYFLPTKFGIDKRKAHFSSLICSKQMEKVDALERLSHPPDSSAGLLSDRVYVLKKLGLSEPEFESIMRQPVRSHFDFETEGGLFDRYAYLGPLRPVWRFLKPYFRKSRLTDSPISKPSP